MEQELENIDHRLPACPDSLSKTIPDGVFGRDSLQHTLPHGITDQVAELKRLVCLHRRENRRVLAVLKKVRVRINRVLA